MVGLLCAGASLAQAQSPTGLASDTPAPAIQSTPSADASKSGASLLSTPAATPSASAVPSASVVSAPVSSAAPSAVELKVAAPSASTVTLSSDQAAVTPAAVRAEQAPQVSTSAPK